MAVQTITEPSADEQKVDLYNTRMRRSNVEVLVADSKYAVCLIRLHPAVNQRGDYPALKVALEAVAGIQDVSLLIDGHAPAVVPKGKELLLVCSAHLRMNQAAGV